MICERCGKEHDGTFATGRFCSKSCANKRNFTDEIRKKISDGVNKDNILKGKIKGNKIYNYICDKCGNIFETKNYIRNSKKKHCLRCKRVVKKEILDAKTIKDFSKRTITKIMKRANIYCSLCSWNEASCDIHHIIQKKDGGSDNMDNLIVLCPNCHRKAHFNLIEVERMLENSFEKVLPNWRDYYNIMPR